VTGKGGEILPASFVKEELVYGKSSLIREDLGGFGVLF